MKRSSHSYQSFALKVISFWILARVSQSYLEPGTTSFLLKIVVSSLVGLVLVSRHIWRTIRSLFAKVSPQRENEDPQILENEQHPIKS